MMKLEATKGFVVLLGIGAMIAASILYLLLN